MKTKPPISYDEWIQNGIAHFNKLAKADSALSSTLLESLERGEASTRAEGIEPNDNPAYLDVKRRLLAQEVSLDEADELYEQIFFQVNPEFQIKTEIIPMPTDGKRKRNL